MRQRPWLLATEQVPDDPCVGHAPVQTQPCVKRGSNVTNVLQLLPDVAVANRLFVSLRVQTCTEKKVSTVTVDIYN